MIFTAFIGLPIAVLSKFFLPFIPMYLLLTTSAAACMITEGVNHFYKPKKLTLLILGTVIYGLLAYLLIYLPVHYGLNL